MSDLIERLCEKAKHLNTTTAMLIIEAVNEIERLQSLSDQNRLTGGVPEGWKAVPKDLGPAWEQVAFNLCNDFGYEFVKGNYEFSKAVWDECLAASPPLPLPGGEEKR